MKYLRPSDDEWNDFITSFDALLNKYQRDIDLGNCIYLPTGGITSDSSAYNIRTDPVKPLYDAQTDWPSKEG